MERRLSLDGGYCPELLATLTTLMPSMKRNAVAGGRIHHVLARGDLHGGHTSLTTMAAGDLPPFGTSCDQP